jgi:hypothetical protein
MKVGPFSSEYRLGDVNLGYVTRALLQRPLATWYRIGLFPARTDYDISYGVVVADPQLAGRYADASNKPQDLVGFVFRHGADGEGSVQNALRNMLLAASTGEDTRGAVFVGEGNTQALAAVDGFDPPENDWLGRLVAGFVNLHMQSQERTLA